MAQTTTKPNGQIPTSPMDSNGAAPSVNRKKQKRRQKQAAKLAAEQPTSSRSNGTPSAVEVKRQMQEMEAKFREHGLDEQYDDQFDPAEGDPYYSDGDGDAYSGSFGQNGSPPNGYAMPASNPGKKPKKKKETGAGLSDIPDHVQEVRNGLSQSHVPLSLPSLDTNGPRGPGISKEKIWNTSSQEERERIKEFWLSLGEDERKSLVKVEKDAVLKKMKEQQKHSCSCTVCGRKRTAIEEELEVLYDAYYEELEQYANHQGDGGPPMMAPHRRFGAMSGLQPPNRLPPAFNGQQPSRGRIVEQLGDDEDEEGDEEYSEEDADEDDYSDEPDELPQNHARDFFNFGNSLTVQGGILTVADDLLKNDGKKFIEMMEQLAERRMAREADATQPYNNADYGHPPNGAMHNHSHTHNHPPPPDDEEYDEEEEEEDEYDSQDEDYDEEEMDTMTEEQRMEEGRRMFQIFAARMFEQRVLTAYKEKVAKERQQKLLEELEEETRADSQKKEKKAKDAQKKKERLQQKKQALAEEKSKRDAAKAAEEKALRDAEEKKAEEARKRAEEKRKKKEAQKKAEEEERLRKDADKQRRLQEQRAQGERGTQREREAKEAKEREAKERKERQENERKDKEAKAKSEKDSKEQQKREEANQANFASQVPKKVPVPIPSNLQPHPPAIASPAIQVATPAVPKAPTPIKLRTSSQQDSNGSIPQTPQGSGMSQNVSPVPSTSQQGSPGLIGPPGKAQNQPHLYHPQAASPSHPLLKSPPPGMPFGGMQPLAMGFQPGMPMMAPGFGGRMHHDPMFPHQPLGAPMRPLPNGMPMHPGFNMHQMPQGRGFPLQHPPPGFTQQMPNNLGGIGQSFAKENAPPSQTHSRQQSASFEKGTDSAPGPPAQPIARPAPIGRPSSVVHGTRRGNNDMDDLSSHLGSSALLDDSDEPLTSGAGARRSSAAPGNSSRQNFAPTPFGMDPTTFGSPISSFGNTWGGPPNPFGTSLPGANYMGGWGNGPSPNSSFGGGVGPQSVRTTQPRGVAIRLNICRACKNLEGSTSDGFYDVSIVKDQVAHLTAAGDAPVSSQELLDICETEGNAMNGGGSFGIRNDGNGQYSIRHEVDLPRSVGAPGDIGSPIVGGGGISRFGGPPPGF
ncbi:Stress response nst1 [Hyphodiscus hymeniophilus]|uniref:Stress response protein NST1 n=1 Tax=Hyphodiscus hymeniophilus TaxID=353542 RepID=A0A9P6VK95_9HELO|nr:Stress response nst1 [Hyphodiscus hymeniophilus]